MTLQLDGFFDLETESWDRFVMGGFVDPAERFQSWTDENECYDYLASLEGKTIWGWNGGLYDFLWIAEIARQRGDRARLHLAGTRIARLELGKVTFRDAIALVPMSLKQASAIVNPDRPISKATGLVCKCGDDCGGYCRIRRSMSVRERALLRSYLKTDCLTGLRIMQAILAEAERCDYQLTGTVGGSSYKTAASVCNLEPAEWRSSEYKYIRKAYFGGRTEVYQPVAEKGFRYDVNSAYPAALVRTALPTGPRIHVGPDRARRAYYRGKEGIFLARVRVPDEMFIPPLPVRLKSGRIGYPVGRFSGHWTALELRWAESCGADVEILGGIVWADAEPVLADFMRHVWDCRARALAEGNPTLSKWHKWVANSCTGKLAELPDKQTVLIHPPHESIRACEGGTCYPLCQDGGARHCGQSKCCDRRCRGTCKSWRLLDRMGTIWAAPFWRLSECSHVHWAAYLTAAARIELHRQLTDDRQAGRTAVYCDTDSCYATEPRTSNVGPELGQWGSEGAFSDFISAGPKLYALTAQSGDRVVRAKGLSGITPDDFAAFLRGQPVARDRGVMGLKSAARKGQLFVRKQLSRTSHADGVHFGSRLLDSDGKTYPLTMARLAAWERGK